MIPAIVPPSERPPRACYSVRSGCLVSIGFESEPPAPLAVLIHSQFRGMILSPAFPCLGGCGAVRRGDYEFAVYDALGTSGAIAACAPDLRRFVDARPADRHPVAAFVAAFHGPLIPSELEFERALWRHLRGLQHLEARPGGAHHLDDGDIPAAGGGDPGFFFAAREFFVVGLHPAASRWARRFAWPTLVFNALTHAEALKESGKYGRMQERILGRDRGLQGSDNPSLPFSQRSQFSGRGVDADWQCPVDRD